MQQGRRAKDSRDGPLTWLYLRRRTRKALLGVVVAAMPIGTATGVITDEMAPLYITLAVSILLPGVAVTDQVAESTELELAYRQGQRDGGEQ